MRKPSLFVLLLLAGLANMAGAQTHLPTFGRQYTCSYPQGPWTNEATNPGWSTFINPQPGADIIYAIEVYKATIPQGQDNRKVAFAKFVDICAFPDTNCLDPESEVLRTRMEFTIKDGVQCTNTVVLNNGREIRFRGCDNGKTRTCWY